MNEFKINNENKITSGFTTPEGYFDDFSIETNNRIILPKSRVKVISINKKRWVTSVAAVLIIVLSITFFTKMEVSNSDDNVLMENYITNNSEISQYDLITLLDNKDIENLSVELNLNDPKMDEEFDNTNEIEFYLTE
ncbi:MAG: hypothetical protein QE264_09090 [Flavobacterium sp.]|jgi:hypothetical protein|nr:hypothetical protein [Flavobacterium sp.]